LTGRQLLFHEVSKLLRFSISGALNSALYGLFSVAFTGLTDWSVTAVHALAFFLCVPVSYLLQRDFTFRYHGPSGQSAFRFFMLMALLFAVGLVTVALVQWLDRSRYIGIVLAILVIPFTSFIAMRYWIFRLPRDCRPDSLQINRRP
jgi:putative flippase GtrA